jgi:glutamyl aminopeptidase
MSAADRANLVYDAFRLALAGKLSYSVALDLTKSLRHENHSVPWQLASTELKQIGSLLKQTSIYESYQVHRLYM